jgi:peptidoglycan/LPS O-acetylase OafA/YrhL
MFSRGKVPDLPALTGIRCVAASLVFLFHVRAIPGNWSILGPVAHLGPFGVAVFFVLSGFILTYTYQDVFKPGVKAADYGLFIWDRLAKVYPLYLFTLLLCIPIQIAGQHREWSWEAFTLNLTLTQCMLPIQNLKLTDQFNVPGWSISCEMLFYILAPLAIWMLFRIKRCYMWMLLAAAWPVSLWLIGRQAEGFIWPSRFAPLRVPEFVVGVATAVCFIRSPKPFKQGWVFVLAGTILIWISIICDQQLPRFLQAGVMAAPGAALLIYGLAGDSGVVGRLLSRRSIVLLGMSSYAFYLIHDPVIRICKGLFQHYQFTLQDKWSSLAFSIVLYVFTQFLSIFLFKQVELPMQRMLRSQMRKKIAEPAPAPMVEFKK